MWCVYFFAWLIVVVIVVLLQTTRGLLHKASITGDCYTARALLEIGVDVDQRDQVFISGLKITDSRSPVMMTGQIFFLAGQTRILAGQIMNTIIFFRLIWNIKLRWQ